MAADGPGPSYVDTLSNLFNVNSVNNSITFAGNRYNSNSRAPSSFEALNELAKVTVNMAISSTVGPDHAPDDFHPFHPINPPPTSTPTSMPGGVVLQTPNPTTTLLPEVINSTLASIVTEIVQSNVTTAPPPPNDVDVSMVNASQRLGLTAFLFTVVVIGVLANSYTVHLILTSAQLQTRWHWWNITLFNLTMADLVSCVLHATTMLVHGDALMMWDSAASGKGTVAVTHRALALSAPAKELESTFFCKFQFVVNFTCFVVPSWILVVGLVERLLALGWSSQYNDLLGYKKLHILFLGAWVVSIAAAGYSAVPDNWIIYNPTTGFCVLNLQNPIGFPWFMLCFFYFVVLPIVLIIPLVIFTLADAESRENAQLQLETQSNLPVFEPVAGAPPRERGPSTVQQQQVPRIQISEIMQWHSRRSSCSEPDEERGTGAGGGRRREENPWYDKLWMSIKAIKLFQSSNRSPVERIRSQRPKGPPPRPPQRGAAGSGTTPPAGNVVDPYGGRLFSMTQERPNLRHQTATELSLVNPQIMHTLLATLTTLVVLKVPAGLLAICKMFATDKSSTGSGEDIGTGSWRLPNDSYAYAEIVTLCMYFVGCAVNPFVYAVLRADFREAMAICWTNCVYAHW